MVQATLKKVWNMAIWVAGAGNHCRKVASINPGQSRSSTKNRAEPRVLNSRWISPARRAFTPAVAEDMRAVTQEPMLVPRMIYSTSFPPVPMVSPATDMAMITEVVAELDCTNAVRNTPASRSRRGLPTVSNRAWTASRLAFMASDMRASPTKISPSPARIMPVRRRPSRLQAMAMSMPAKVRICT